MNRHAIETLRLWESRLLVLLIYTLPLHEPSKNVLWGLLVAVWTWRSVLEGKPPPLSAAAIGVIAWFLAGIWSSLFAIEPIKSWQGVWDVLRGAALFFIVGSRVMDQEERISLLRHLVISAAITSCVGWFDFAGKLWGPTVAAPWLLGKIFGPDAQLDHIHIQLRSVGQYNQSGNYLAMATILALVAALDPRVFARPWLARASLAVIALALLGTTARTAIMVTALVATGILLVRRAPRWLWMMMLAGGLLVAAAVAVSPGLRNRIHIRVSLGDRVEFWQGAMQVVEKRPWTGVGLNNFKNIAHLDRRGHMFSIDHAHNLYLTTLAQTGYPGFIAFGSLLAALAALIWRQRRDPDALWFHAGAGVWLVVTGVGMTNTTIHHEMSVLFFIVMGLVWNEVQARRKLSAVSSQPSAPASKH